MCQGCGVRHGRPQDEISHQGHTRCYTDVVEGGGGINRHVSDQYRKDRPIFSMYFFFF